MPVRIKKIRLKGFRSIRELDFEARPLNVFIGANGAGKSNLLMFFRMLGWMMKGGGNFQSFVGLNGGAGKFLFDGPKTTPGLSVSLELEAETGGFEYEFDLAWAASDQFVFTRERFRHFSPETIDQTPWEDLGSGHREAELLFKAEGGDEPARTVVHLMRRMVVHQFHDTSHNARIRGKWHQDDSRSLKEDGANLAAVLLRMKEHQPVYYRRNVGLIRNVFPSFDDFFLEPEHNHLLLRWTEKGTDNLFTVDQASDGTLRFMALIALLAQPEDEMPDLFFLDEPELGLHPYAIGAVAGFVNSLALKRQVFVATQSSKFIDYFEPDDLIVVEIDRIKHDSHFTRMSTDDLDEWRDLYSVSDLWDKNILGGRP